MQQPELRRLQAGGHSVAYRTAGEGPPLVLLHGFLCDSRVWRQQLTALSDRFRVIAWDAPGAGSSWDPPLEFGITDWARCLAEFLTAFGVGRAHLLGLSWGGLLAQEFYRLYPERIQRLVLADTYAGWKGSLPGEACDKRLARCLQESTLASDEFVRRWVPNEFFAQPVPEALVQEMSRVIADFHPQAFRLMAKSLAEADTTSLLPKIDVPTLLLWGEGDRRSPLSIAAEFHRAIPHSELAIIRGAGHVSNMERPDEFSAEVRRFCGPPLTD